MDHAAVGGSRTSGLTVNGDIIEVVAIMALTDRDEIVRRIRRASIATRSELVIVADLALVLPVPFDRDKHARQLFALAVVLATPLAINQRDSMNPDSYESVAAREPLHRLMRWIILGLCHRTPDDPPPVSHEDRPWLEQVVVANAHEPWIPRLLAAMAAVA